jgi:Protein of unknown function (DUF3800)
MRLRDGGIDIFYIDESHDQTVYVITAVTVPFLRKVDGIWNIVWPDHFDAAKAWRRGLKASLTIPSSKELHGIKLASGRGRYKLGKWQFDKAHASSVYRQILRSIDFIPNASIMSVAVHRGAKNLYGRTRLEAALYALLQRMRMQCNAPTRNTNAIVFFDEGHPEYRKLYRQAQVYLPTGSILGQWASGLLSKNLPLDMFTKDGNDKPSRHCQFTQTADLVAYAAFLKIKAEQKQLTDWQAKYKLGTLYDELPQAIRNTAAQKKKPRDAIVRLK